MSHSLQTLLEGIYASVLEARRFVNLQHLQLFQSYFETKVVKDRATGEDVEVYVPRLVAMATSRGVGTQEHYDIVEAPAITLVPMSTLNIDTLEIEFEAKLASFEIKPHEDKDDEQEDEKDEQAEEPEKAEAEEDDTFTIIRRTIDDLFDTASEITVMTKGDSFESSASPAKVKVTFKMTNPPEGVELIQEQLLDYLRSSS
ncbi:DUF2589 domain-containing protein [Salipiger abyssi]|uniref:DUF2589 domain-containing protein n=1 Tax=Salipiger abyssi TaxID=1250539 RepID=UPI001A8E12E7|nr:DUF2589 domain-containing protein [Salipiger abyssi]MBN9888857.1 DUF2589 domain-containing protein [Salipiger abyssi]